MRYYDLQRHWTHRIEPHLGDRRINATLVRDFRQFTLGNWNKPFTRGQFPRDFESCDWWLVRASVGAFHICLWTFTMTEAWAWNRVAKRLVGHRSASPWDDETRRPSHADKRRAWRRELLGNEIRAVLRPGATEQELQAAAERMLNLAA